MKYICKQCGKEFEITEGEAEFFLSKGMELPKRCKECRQANKIKKENDSDAAIRLERKPSKVKNLKVILGVVAILILAGFGFSKLPALINNNSGYDDSSVSTTVYTFSGYGTSSAIAGEAEEYLPVDETMLTFRNVDLLISHYQKHGAEVGASSPDEYQRKAAAVVSSENVLHKTESEDGDYVYFNPSTGEFVIVSTDGYIRTYYIADMDYFERQ